MTRYAPMSEEARLQIAVVAGATERSNRPRFLLLLALIALIGAGLYAATAAARLASARDEVRRVRETRVAVDRFVQELRAAQSARQTDGATPDPQAAQKLRQIALRVGLPSSINLGSGQNPDAPGYVRKRYTVTNFRVPDIAPVLEWLQQATGENSVGLTNVEINTVRLRPLRTNQTTASWEVDVTFTRLERDR